MGEIKGCLKIITDHKSYNLLLSSLKSHVANYINICANKKKNQCAESIDGWLGILKLMERTPII